MEKSKIKQNSVLSASDLKRPSGKLIYGAFIAILLVVSVISLIPAIWTIATAFKDTKEIYSEFSFFPKNISLSIMASRISDAWGELQLGESIINTIILSLGNLVFRIVVCGFGGYVLSKLKPKGSTLLFTLVVWTMLMPSQIRMVPNYITNLHFPFAYDIGIGVNLLDSYWPMWLISGADCFAVLLFKNSFDALSNSYVEAAKLDGCTNFGIFFKIMFPLAKPIVIYESINVLSGVWADFFSPLLYLENTQVVPLKIYKLAMNPSIQMNTYFMSLIFASIPPLIIFVVFQKRILGGINVGGVKG